MGPLYGVDGSASALRRDQLRAAIGLSAVFVLAYSACNFFTSSREDVGVWAYAWELRIPLVPEMIVPYMSIDLFFVGAPFLCTTRRELEVHTRRILLSVLIATVFFLAVPLELAFDRPEVNGWEGWIFRFLHIFDEPHNLFPSLHIVLLAVVGGVYLRRSRGILRAILWFWFALVFVSTILTWQHHVVDIAGGVVAATIVFYLAPRDVTPTEPGDNGRVAAAYGAGAALFVLLAVSTWRWGGGLALWPCTSLGFMAIGYAGWGAAVWRKIDGRLPVSCRFVHAPCRLGQWASFLYYRRSCRAWDEIAPGVLLGRTLSPREARRAVETADVRSVLDLTAEFGEVEPFLATDYLNLPVLDLTAPSSSQLERAVSFIEERRSSGAVYIHGKMGFSRGAAVAAAWMLHARRASSVDEAIDRLRTARHGLVVRPEVRPVLETYDRSLRETELPSHGHATTPEPG